MKYSHSFLIFTLLIFTGSMLQGQASKTDFKAVDDYVRSLGPLDSLNTGTISHIVTKNFPDPKDKVRAIFVWVANNISFDLKAGRNNDNEKLNTDLILKSRKANAAGYAALFQDMCSVVKIRCLTVDGYAKYSTENINEKPDEFNHTWAVVQLGQSPDSWYYVDPTWGSGYTDDKMKVFTRSFNDDYFFADKVIFNLQHFPDNEAWRLGPGPKNLSSFFSLPLVKSAAYEFQVTKFTPNNGALKAKADKALPFSLTVQPRTAVDIVALEIGEGKKKKVKTVDYTISGGAIRFSYKFEEEDAYPVTVLINNKPVLGYTAEIGQE